MLTQSRSSAFSNTLRFGSLCLIFTSMLQGVPAAYAASMEYYVAPDGTASSCTVDTPCALNTGLGKAQAGDEVVLKDGVYNGTFTLPQSGTAAQSIVIRAQNPRQTTFASTTFFLKGSHALLDGFVFEGSEVVIRGNYNRVTRSIFRLSGKNLSAVRIDGDASYNRIDHNELTNWQTYGFRIMNCTDRTTGNRIDHNYIHDYSLVASNSPEAFQIGANQEDSFLNIGTIVEYNLVERVQLNGEILSVKSSGNMVRSNTFRDTSGTVQARHGVNNTFQNNTIMQAKALQAYGDNHRLIGNLLVDTDIYIPSGDITQDDLRTLPKGHPAARNQLVAGNIVQNGKILVGKSTCCSGAKAAQNTTIAGNEGPIVTTGAKFNHTGTQILATYHGDAGVPVLMTREMVGPEGNDDRGGDNPTVLSPSNLRLVTH